MIRINLLPRERARPAAPAPLRVLGLVAALLVVLAGVATIALNTRNDLVRAEIRDLDAKIAELQPKVAHVEQLKKLIQEAQRKEALLKRLESARIPWDDVLLELRVVMPRDVWLTQITAANDGSLVFNGFGLSYTSVARFMVNVEGSRMFEGTDLTTSQKQLIAARQVINFSVTSRLSAKRTEASTR